MINIKNVPNTVKIKRLLEKLNIHPHPGGYISDNPKVYLFINRGFYSQTPIGYQEELDNSIDVKGHEQLTVDLLNIKTDTDKNQWFWFDNIEDYGEEKGWRGMYKCRSSSIEIDLCYDMMFTYCTRATQQQIVDYYLRGIGKFE